MYKSKKKDKIERMNVITAKVRSCLRCELGEHRKNVVVGSGDLDSNIVLIGEAPGRKEDESGLPFVGSAGNLLDRLLNLVDLRKEDVFICNILKCRPQRNRRPKKAEIESCEDYLISQLEIIKPNVIVPMGNSALSYFQSRYGFGNDVIGKDHGKVYEIAVSWGKVSLIPLYHPAAALYRRYLMIDLEKDIRKIINL